MTFTLFGWQAQLQDGQTVSFEVNGTPAVDASLNLGKLQVLFKIDVNIDKGVFKYHFPLNTGITFDVNTKVTTIGGNIEVSLFGAAVTALTATFDQNLVLSFSGQISQGINDSLYNILLSPGFVKFNTLIFPAKNPGIVLKNFIPIPKDGSIELYCGNDYTFSVTDKIYVEDLAEINGIEFGQKLLFEKIILWDNNNYNIYLAPELHYLPIHPDVFTTFDQAYINNLIQYQFGLCNGVLCLSKTTALPDGIVFWTKHPDNDVKPALLLFHYADQNGSPVVINTSSAVIPLKFRTGLLTLYPQKDTDDLQKTIEGISIGDITDGMLNSIHHSSIDWAAREVQHHNIGFDGINDVTKQLQSPFWLKQPIVQFYEKEPDEIYGVNRGIVGRRQKTDNRFFDITSTPIQYQGDDVYHHISFLFPTDKWSFFSNYEEHEVNSQVTPAPTGPVDINYKNLAVNGQNVPTVALPAYNYSLSISNIYNPNLSAAAIAQPEITKAVVSTIQNLNALFTGPDINFSVSDELHISGFRRNYANGPQQPLQNFLVHPGGKTIVITDTVVLPPQIAAKPVDFKHGTQNPAPQGWQNMTAPSPDLPSAAINSFKQLQRIWNQFSFHLSDTSPQLKEAACAIFTVRQFLDNVLPTEQGIRVNVFGGFYRLQIKILLTSDDTKAHFFQQLRILLNGNPDAIPGLGQYINLAKNTLSAVLKKADRDINGAITDLQVYWDAGVSAASADVDIALNALFDYIYKPCDWQLVNDFARILTDKTAAYDAVQIIRKYFQPIFTVADTAIGDEVSQVITSAQEGINPYFNELAALWNKFSGNIGCGGLTSDYLFNKYGRQFDVRLYQRLIADSEPAVINCLTQLLTQAIVNELTTLVSSLIDRIVQGLSGDTIELLRSYEEQIYNFFLIIDGWYNFWNANKTALATIVGGSVSAATFKAAFLALPAATQQVLYEKIASYLNNTYGVQVKSWNDAVAAGLDNTLTQILADNWDTIQLVLSLIDQYNDWTVVMADYEAQFKQVSFEVLNLVKSYGNRAYLKAALITYIKTKFHLDFTLADLKVDPPKYLVYSKHVGFKVDLAALDQFTKLTDRLHLQNYGLSAFSEKNDDGSDKKWNFVFQDTSVFVLKLANDIGFAQILSEINLANTKDGKGPLGTQPDIDALVAMIDEGILTNEWRGLLILNPLADISRDPLVKQLAGRSSIKMPYAAVGGTNPASMQKLDVYARIFEQNDPAAVTPSQDSDALLTLVKFDATIKNTTLEAGEIMFYLSTRNLFGKGTDPLDLTHRITILGTVPQKKPGDNTTPDFQFAALLATPLVYTLNFGFFNQLILRGIKAERKNQRSLLSIDGSLTFQDFTPVVGIEGSALNLNNFRIILPDGSGNTRMGLAQYVNFDIGSIEFVIDKPRSINYLGLELLAKGIGYIKDFTGNNFNQFSGPRLWIKAPQAGGMASYISLSITFGNLPILGGTGSNSFQLDGVLGFSHNGASPTAGLVPFFGIDGAGGQQIDIDFFRFLSLHIDNFDVGPNLLTQSNTPVTAISVDNAQLKILDWSLFGSKGLSLLFLHSSTIDKANPTHPDNGFLGFADIEQSFGPFSILWALVAHNLDISPDVLNALMRPAQANDLGGLLKAKLNYKPGVGIDNILFTRAESWLFGGAFSLAGILDNCAIIFQDQHYYGVNLASSQPWFKAIFGVDQFTLAYIPGDTRDQDKFRVELPLPALNFFGQLKSGLVALETAINQDFLFDFGFPWKTGNTYLWERTFSFPAGVYEIRFGFFIQKTTIHVPNTGTTDITLSAGIAFSYGYHIGARTAIAYADAGISVTMVLTGAVTITFGTSGTSPYAGIKEISVTGVIGIYAYAEGGINLWVITAVLRAQVVAAIAGTLDYVPAGHSSLAFSATLSVSFHAECSVSFGFFHAHFSVSGMLSYGVAANIALN